MNITKEGWAKIIGAVLLAIATIAGTLLGVDVQLQNAQVAGGGVIGSQALTERINLDSFGDNQISNGGDLTFWSGARTGQTIKLKGDDGSISASTLTVASLISQVVSFVGENGNITDTLLVETLTVTGTATADGFSSTYLTGTLGTAAQPNVTSVGDLTSLSVGGGYASTGCDLTAVGNANCAGNGAFGGDVAITGTTTAGTVYVNGYLRSSNGPVTAFDPFTALKEFTATKGVIINGTTFTMTDPITITDVLTNVRLLYYQVP